MAVAPQIGDGFDFLMILGPTVEGRHNGIRAVGLTTGSGASLSLLEKPT